MGIEIADKIMIHLNHSCKEIDIVEVETHADREIMRGQGYLSLNELRNLKEKYEECISELLAVD